MELNFRHHGGLVGNAGIEDIPAIKVILALF